MIESPTRRGLRALIRLGARARSGGHVVQLLLPKCEGGIGDFVRGSIFAHELCLELGHAFQVDASRHPVGACLETPVVVDPAGAHDTRADLFTLLRASHVESYSVYAWGSGFVQWPCLLANVPFRLNVLGAAR